MFIHRISASFFVACIFFVAIHQVDARSLPNRRRSVDDEDPKGTTSVVNPLFPVDGFTNSWTTDSSVPNALPLTQSTLRPSRVTSAGSFVSAHNKQSILAAFPKGAHTFGNPNHPPGGFLFYAQGPSNFDLSSAKEVTFGYRVFFEAGFAFNKGGKLPGISGGTTESQAAHCPSGPSIFCFLAQLMWRTNGQGELYTSLPSFNEPRFAVNRKQCDVAPQSVCDTTLGYRSSVGRGSFRFETGRWNTVAERVKLNDVGQANGELELFVNGRSVINVDGLILRDRSTVRFQGLRMQASFGEPGSASDPSWASPKAQKAWFSDFSVAILETL